MAGVARELSAAPAASPGGSRSRPARGSALFEAQRNRRNSGVYTGEMDKKMWHVWGMDVFLR